MDYKTELLKKLGFSDSFIKQVNEETIKDLPFAKSPDSTSLVEPFDIAPSDSNEIIIQKTSKPQSMVYNSNEL